VLRGGRSSQADYIQYGKGRDVGLAQIALFNSKISMGNGEQVDISNDNLRLFRKPQICLQLVVVFGGRIPHSDGRSKCHVHP
jgi:hypothetical protein